MDPGQKSVSDDQNSRAALVRKESEASILITFDFVVRSIR